MKKEYLIGAGILGAAIGFAIGTKMTLKKCEESINKEVKEAINKEVKNNVINELDIKDLRKEVKEEATEKVANAIEQKTDKKLKEFDDRLKVMEDIDAKKLELGKAAVVGFVTISTTLIKAYYDNRKHVHSHAEYAPIDTVKKLAEVYDKNFEIVGNAFSEAETRIAALEVK